MYYSNNHWLKEFAITSAIIICGVIGFFYVETTIGRHLSPKAYGDYRVIMTVLTFFGQFLLLGFDSIIIKHIPKLLLNREVPKAKFFLITILKIIIFVLSTWVVISLFINPLAHKLEFNKITAGYVHPAYFYLGFASILASFVLMVKIIKSLGYNILSVLTYNVRIFIFAGLIYFTSSLNIKIAVFDNGISWAISTCMIFVFIFFFLKNNRSIRFDLPDDLYHDAFHYATQQVWTFPTPSILLILIEALPVAEPKVGIFSAIFMIASLANNGNTVMRSVFLNPILNTLYENKLLIRKLLFKIYGIAFGFALSISIVLYLLAPYLIKFYGIHFNSALRLIPFAILGNIPAAITCGDTIFINFSDSHTNRLFTYLTIFKIVLALVCGITFISLFSLDGAVFAFITIETIFAILVVLLKYRTLKYSHTAH